MMTTAALIAADTVWHMLPPTVQAASAIASCVDKAIDCYSSSSVGATSTTTADSVQDSSS